MKERTNEELNRVIAEWRGWKEYDNQPPLCRWKHEPTGFWNLQPPDYCNDLDAICEACSHMTDSQWSKYIDNVFSYFVDSTTGDPDFQLLLSLSARQRSEVLVKVIEEGRR